MFTKKEWRSILHGMECHINGVRGILHSWCMFGKIPDNKQTRSIQKKIKELRILEKKIKKKGGLA